MATEYQVSIGLEVHVQLKTRSKMFCGCGTRFGLPPNTQVCPVCLGYPGTLPVINREAIRLTVRAGLMLGCRINPYSKFDRKNYFYPDMPKNYQISQYDRPLCLGGAVEIAAGGRAKTVRLRRIHLEEDVGKNMHFGQWSGVDFNRAGIPLMEIVTEPDLESPEEALAFLLALKQTLTYAEVSDCNLEQGNLRCDVNCSVRPRGAAALGTKTELKNLNTFKGVFQALEAEIARQIEVLRGGGALEQETRRWDAAAGVTLAMRSKEEAHDYRYFPEPDLLPVVLTEDLVREWAATLPEGPRERRERFRREYGLPEYDARVLTADRTVADYFEAAARGSRHPKSIANWVMTDVLRVLGERGWDATAFPIAPAALAELVELTENGTLNSTTAREVFGILLEQGGMPGEIVRSRGLAQVSDASLLEELVARAVAEHPKSVADYRRGKKAALQFLVGQVMRLSAGKASPERVRVLLEQKLDSGAG